ncbi:MAG: PAS domain-containing protein [Candidatus Thorarchaeota archaeon]
MTILRELLDKLHIGIVLVGNDDKILAFNKMAGEMLQQDPEDRIGTSIFRCHGEPSEEPVRKMLNDMRNGRMESYEGWVNFQGRILFEYIYPLPGPDGECHLVVEELHDAAEKVEYLKSIGEWELIHVSGVGEKAPRPPER